MKISEQWLRDWINPPQNTTELAAWLTMGGLEVDQITPVAGAFEGVVVAEVLETKRHPEADKLTLCKVNLGQEVPIQVVCGASNVRPGLKVALATVGAKLPQGFEIKAAKLRGEHSHGMLCSFQELGMADKSEGILELEADAPVGVNIREYFKLDDHVFDIELTPNRGDCLSILGVAREISAKTQHPFTVPCEQPIATQGALPFPIEVQSPEACPWYTGRLITNIHPDIKTPLWMKERLRRAGVRPLHFIVDVTQYVMLELGQPLHAFNPDQIKDGIVVRMSEENEQLTLLDGQTITLNTSLVIADQEKILALAGIMGGKKSAVEEGATTVFLESAFFAPKAMAGVARSYGLSTDAAYRYERGVDPMLPQRALEYATYLIQTLAGGIASEIQSVQQPSYWFEAKTVVFRPARVSRKLGVEMSLDRMHEILKALGFQIQIEDEANWKVTIPSYRFDIAIEEDIIEELIRIEGYDQLPPAQTITELKVGTEHPIEQIERKASGLFCALGYREVINYSFVDPTIQSFFVSSQQTLNLLNPISPELSQMRVSLWPGLLATMLYNLHRQQDSLALFECGRVFDRTTDVLNEIPKIAALLTGQKNALSWTQRNGVFDFYDLKGDMESLFQGLHLERIQFIPKAHEALHPGQSAVLMLNGKEIGWCGMLHPKLPLALDIPNDVFLFECELEALTQSHRTPYQVISKYPKIRRDLAFIVDESVSFSDIERAIRASIPADLLKSIHVFDVYAGEGIPDGKKSIALALIIQSDDKTLKDEEIHVILNAIIKSLEVKLSMILRDGS